MSKLYIFNRDVLKDTAESLEEAELKVAKLRAVGVWDSIIVTDSPEPTYWRPNKKELEG